MPQQVPWIKISSTELSLLCQKAITSLLEKKPLASHATKDFAGTGYMRLPIWPPQLFSSMKKPLGALKTRASSALTAAQGIFPI
jgi:hypothetical protein